MLPKWHTKSTGNTLYDATDMVTEYRLTVQGNLMFLDFLNSSVCFGCFWLKIFGLISGRFQRKFHAIT